MDPVRYDVRFPAPETHLVECTARFPREACDGDALIVSMPVWTPGSYLVREFARLVEGMRAADETGAPLSCTRLDKARWRIARPASGAIVLSWKVYARELTVRTSYLDHELASLNGANLFVTADAVARRPCEVSFEVRPGQRLVTTLPAGSGPNRFVARDFDQLCDCPVVIGELAVLEFQAAGKPHVLAVAGGAMDLARVAGDLTKVVEGEAKLFGGLPYERYAFLVLLTDKGRGGLEHEDSTALLYPRNGLADPKGYEDFLQLATHELFHAWNVKRIKPAAFTPYDYSREQYTRLLWFFEGLTSYYDLVLPVRAGLYSAERFLEKLGESATEVARAPGRLVSSLEEASLVAWVKYYRPDETTPNTTVSYYVKGEATVCLLDLTIRRATGGARSMDDVLRLLWERHGKTGIGVPEEGLRAVCVEVGGPAAGEFHDRFVAGTEELPWEELCGAAGLEVLRRAREGEKDRGGTPGKAGATPKGWFGANVRDGERPTLTHVLRGTPAEQAGLAPDDELVALDGEKLDGGTVATRLEEKRPGERGTLHYFRRGQLRSCTVVFGERPRDTLCFSFDPHASATAIDLRRGWLTPPPISIG